MKSQTLVKGLMCLTVVSVMTGCVDNSYDLKNIDKTSRFTVDSLTVPVNLSTIKLQNVIDLDDDDLIKTVDGEYVIKKSGDIAKTAFSIKPVTVPAPTIAPTDFTVGLGIPVVEGVVIPVSIDKTIDFKGPDPVDYKFEAENIDGSLERLDNVKTTTIKIQVSLTVPTMLRGEGNEISFTDLKFTLPRNLINVQIKGAEDSEYSQSTGESKVKKVIVGSNGKAVLDITAEGLKLVGEEADVTDHILKVEGKVGISEGNINLKVNNVKLDSSDIKIDIDYQVSAFDIKSFSGYVNYKMNSIHIDPITLNNLPDFLKNDSTKLIIANPQILVSISNPVGKWLNMTDGNTLKAEGKISLTSNFKNKDDGKIEKVEHASSPFYLVGDESNLAFCNEETGYTTVEFDGLRNVLANGASGLPESIDVNIHDIRFYGDVKDFTLGTLGDAEGSYKFNAPLGFGKGSKVIYESTEDGWGSDDLDKVNINKIHLKAKCSTNLPVSVMLTVVPIDKSGQEIRVSEDSGTFFVPPFGDNTDVSLLISGIKGANGKIIPIKDFDGVRFRATIEQNQDNTEAIGPDLFIELKDLKVTVDGYYETDF